MAARNPPPRDHVPACQNLRPVHARDARRRAWGRRRHGRLRVLSAVPATPQPRDRAGARQAGQGPGKQGGADGRCRRCDAFQHRRNAAAGSAAVARQRNHRTAARRQDQVRPAGHEGDRGRDGDRPRRAAGFCRRGRPHAVRRPRAKGRHPPRRARRRIRLACAGKPGSQAAVYGFRRPHPRQSRGSRSRHPRRRHRRLLGRRAIARSQGSRDDPEIYSRRARNRRTDGPMNPNLPNSFRSGPDERGHFGIFGGRFVAETLMPLILDLEKAYADAKADPAFQAEMNGYLRNYVGRPSPLYFAERLTEHLGGAKIYFKREELNHTGSHKVNNVLGQIMVARRMGKKRIIAETGAGQHGVATATLCARFGLECLVYMGAVDVERQQANVIRMEMLGAKVIPVQSGSRTLKDAMNDALRDWVANVEDTFYIIGTVAGPHPYPTMVRDFQSVIGDEAKQQHQEAEGRLPDALVACIGGGSNAMGLFHPFLDDPTVEIFGVEAAGHGLTQLHAASIAGGRPGVLHGNRTYLLMDADGQIQDAHSISAGLDYPGIGPEHSWLHETGRVTYLSATDDEALAAFQLLSKLEGIIPALEPAHAIAKVMELAPKRTKDHLMVVNLSGRGDKDVPQVGDILKGRKK